MILAAGLGTRLKPFTDNHPKALAPVNGKTLLQRNIEYLQQYGFDDLIINVHHFTEQFTDIILQNNGWGSKITISDESDMVLETGGGLLKAAHFFKVTNLPFLLMNVDILTDLDLHKMLEFHQQQRALATLAIRRRETSRYLLFDEENKMVGWKNIKTNEIKQVRDCTSPAFFAFSGVHIIQPDFFKSLTLTGKFSMIDAYLELAKTNNIIGFEHSESKMIDVGTTASIIEAEKIFL